MDTLVAKLTAAIAALAAVVTAAIPLVTSPGQIAGAIDPAVLGPVLDGLAGQIGAVTSDLAAAVSARQASDAAAGSPGTATTAPAGTTGTLSLVTDSGSADGGTPAPDGATAPAPSADDAPIMAAHVQ